MGTQQNTYRSNGYNKPQYLFNDIIDRNPIRTTIIPNNISITSKMYKKVLNFTKSTDLFWKNGGPLTINYNLIFSNSKVPVNGNINIEKYCICTWIDESSGTQQHKEKYMPGQDVELIRHVFAFDANSKLIKKKEYSYNQAQKIDILKSCERNNSNLLIDHMNTHYYTEIYIRQNIHCSINGIQY